MTISVFLTSHMKNNIWRCVSDDLRRAVSPTDTVTTQQKKMRLKQIALVQSQK